MYTWVSTLLFFVVENCTFQCPDDSGLIQHALHTGPVELRGYNRSRRHESSTPGAPPHPAWPFEIMACWLERFSLLPCESRSSNSQFFPGRFSTLLSCFSVRAFLGFPSGTALRALCVWMSPPKPFRAGQAPFLTILVLWPPMPCSRELLVWNLPIVFPVLLVIVSVVGILRPIGQGPSSHLNSITVLSELTSHIPSYTAHGSWEAPRRTSYFRRSKQDLRSHHQWKVQSDCPRPCE